MKNFCLLFLMTAISVYAADFRNVTWGMTMDAVKKAETVKLTADDEANELRGDTKLGQEPVTVVYRFDAERKLIAARYEFKHQYRDSQKYIEAYDALQAQLETKYGQPILKQVMCDDMFYRDYPQRWGTGVVVGKLVERARWDGANAGKLQVQHWIRMLPGGNVVQVVQYQPVKSAQQSAAIDSGVFGAL